MGNKALIIFVIATAGIVVGLFQLKKVISPKESTKKEESKDLSQTQNTSGLTGLETDPVVDCTFVHTGVAPLKKSVCKTLIECQVGDQWKVASIAACKNYYQELCLAQAQALATQNALR